MNQKILWSCWVSAAFLYNSNVQQCQWVWHIGVLVYSNQEAQQDESEDPVELAGE
jgi:hypothetical protein